MRSCRTTPGAPGAFLPVTDGRANPFAEAAGRRATLPPPGVADPLAGAWTPAAKPLPVVAYQRKGETYAKVACGFSIGVTTVHRYLTEA